ncbi:MAG: hypothetical protein VR69_13200 [Peptococcaceae bacterium BRH_c4b]|nr:MAG: hypothetical protein VR69_13200 [Peptococcaceae bacterium BRH_c4b]
MFSKNEVDKKVQELTAGLADKSPLSIATIKKLIHQGMELNLQAAIKLEILTAVQYFTSEDVIIGLEAFQQKKSPFSQKDGGKPQDNDIQGGNSLWKLVSKKELLAKQCRPPGRQDISVKRCWPAPGTPPGKADRQHGQWWTGGWVQQSPRQWE